MVRQQSRGGVGSDETVVEGGVGSGETTVEGGGGWEW